MRADAATAYLSTTAPRRQAHLTNIDQRTSARPDYPAEISSRFALFPPNVAVNRRKSK